jgi:hypothetical protein
MIGFYCQTLEYEGLVSVLVVCHSPHPSPPLGPRTRTRVGVPFDVDLLYSCRVFISQGPRPFSIYTPVDVMVHSCSPSVSAITDVHIPDGHTHYGPRYHHARILLAETPS